MDAKKEIKKKKYNLSILQWIFQVPILRLFWLLTADKDRKTWHEVLKGIERHTCAYTIKIDHNGHEYFICNHPGCILGSYEKTII